MNAVRKLNKNQLLECALCAGAGAVAEKQCLACFGHGTVEVEEPIVACPACEGYGRAQSQPGLGSHVCTICSGTGWLFPIREA